MFSLSDAANGIRRVFADLVGGDVANNPHVLTRTFAKGTTFNLTILGGNGSGAAVGMPGVSAVLLLQMKNPDGTWTTVSTMIGGPTSAAGLVVLSDTSTIFDLTQTYQIVVTATFPDGSTQEDTLQVWTGAASGNWGQGFSPQWLTTYVLGGSSSGSATQGVTITVYPTSGNYPLRVQGAANPWIGATGLSFAWYLKASGATLTNEPIGSGQSMNVTLYGTETIFCVMTDSAGAAYTSPSVVVTVNGSPPPPPPPGL